MRILTLLCLFSTLCGHEWLHDIHTPQTEEVAALFAELEATGQVIETGSDDLRIKYVHAQGCIEQLLAQKQQSGEIHNLIGFIHTPLPATPLCVQPDQPSPIDDPKKWETVLSRAQILREYLHQNGILYIVYPQGGLQQRTPEQQRIYTAALSQFSTLFDYPLATNHIDPDMIGATYIFFDSNDQAYAFSIKARQITDMQPQAEWGLWFGPATNEHILQRIRTIFDYLSSHGGPSL